MKNILLIGGNSGIGHALALKLKVQGHQLYIAARQTEELSSLSPNVQQLDLSNMDRLELPEKLDGLVYCPGSIKLKPFHRFSLAEFQADMEVNAFGAAEVIQRSLPALKGSPNASVILFSSVAAQQGLAFHSSISMAKGAVEGLTVALAAELAPKIRVNAIAPSLTDTPLASALLNSDTKKEASANRHPLKRVGTAEGCAGLASYLLSDEAAFISGQIYKIDGGLSSLTV